MTQEKNTPAALTDERLSLWRDSLKAHGLGRSHCLLAGVDELDALIAELQERRATTPPPALEGGSRTPRVSKSDEHSTSVLDERVQELRRAQSIINGLRDYRENLLTCRADLEPSGRLRIVEMSNPPRDDHDRAVLLLVADYERLLKAIVATIKPVQKATGGDTRGEANPSPPPQEGLVEALELVRGIIKDAAMEGFNYQRGDWADRLFKSQAVTFAALSHHRAGVKT